jgi:hypothetical protein
LNRGNLRLNLPADDATIASLLPAPLPVSYGRWKCALWSSGVIGMTLGMYKLLRMSSWSQETNASAWLSPALVVTGCAALISWGRMRLLYAEPKKNRKKPG